MKLAGLVTGPTLLSVCNSASCGTIVNVRFISVAILFFYLNTKISKGTYFNINI